jgi:hypothetical protein
MPAVAAAARYGLVSITVCMVLGTAMLYLRQDVEAFPELFNGASVPNKFASAGRNLGKALVKVA